MSEVKVSEEVGASAEAVWKLLRDFGGIQKWSGGGIESCSVEGEGIGAVRTIGIAGGASLQERLEAFDDERRTFNYSIIGASPLPLTDYLSTVAVTGTGADSSRVDWSASFEPKGISEEQAQQLVRGIYTGGIAGLKKTLGV